ncbi:MAG: aminopeptidase [Bacteroidia bacterium]|nr:C1 family peptidase [Bacteroidales bacterium]NCD40529.1 aminopeptidase [Bacteroidia bacterium]MDD2322004.1 C1 family peptidase [Bacteroidales bacterium]MDD3960830.1 C1 family peptidase [Bacteroidales bacterium]MDY0284687.1 C1 family peptidase [Bacteroidales bacterium]
MRRKIFLVVLGLITLSGYLKAQTDGAITPEILSRFREAYSLTPEKRAATNAMYKTDIRTLALNHENAGKTDPYFSHRVSSKGITDQKSSGRCWLFASLNVMRPKVISTYNLDQFDFSANYNFFYDQLEKANLFMEGIIETRALELNDRKVEWLLKNAIGDGGVWNGFVNMIEKYGLVPATVMPETHASENTAMISRLIARKLRENALQLRKMHEAGKNLPMIRKEKEAMLQDIYAMLAVSLGEPPTTFTWRYKDADGNVSDEKEYTPQSFYTEFVGVDLSDYVMLMNDPTRPYNALYEIDYDRNSWEGLNWRFINLPNKRIKQFAIESIKNNEALYFSCDVGKQLDRKNGYLDVNNYDYESLLGVDFGMDKRERILTFESGSSHGMTLMAVDLDKNDNPSKWLLENSWGEASGYQGHLIMTDAWFDEYMFRVVVNKAYIDIETLRILESEPTLLPPWDPMFAPVK